jgi:hypothetical protein
LSNPDQIKVVCHENYQGHSHYETHHNQEKKDSLCHKEVLNNDKITWSASKGVAWTIYPSILKDILMKFILSKKSARDTAPIAER